MDGDVWLDLGFVGVFDWVILFSVSLWVKIFVELENGVIFYKGIGVVLYNFWGYYLVLKDNCFEVLMVCMEFYNVIIEYSNKVFRD